MAVSYHLFAHFQRGFSALYTEADRGVDLGSWERAVDLLHNLQGFHVPRFSYKWYEKRLSPPPLPLDVKTLKGEAKRRLGFTPKQTIALSKSLHRKGLITTLNTANRAVGSGLTSRLQDTAQGLPETFHEEKQRAFMQLQTDGVPPNFRDRACNAPRPILLPGHCPPERGRPSTSDEGALYDLVCRIFLAGLLPAHEYTRVTLHWNLGGHRFANYQDTTVIQGWTTVLDDLELRNWGIDPANIEQHQLLDSLDAVQVGDLDPDHPRVFIGCCPKCGQGQVEEKQEHYACNNWHQGCRFQIAKQLFGKHIGLEHARQLVVNGATEMIPDFTLASGRRFDARFRLANNKVIVQPAWRMTLRYPEGRITKMPAD
jgi:DNA topoisomerase IA